MSPEQFSIFIDKVYQRYPDPQDPTTAEVTEEVIVPDTIDSGLSFALQHNVYGRRIKYFISHDWRHSFKRLAQEIQKLIAKEPGNIWICFLANPQTWKYEELDMLLGTIVWQSPFVLALREAEAFVIVRDTIYNPYDRLWCVLERVLADHFRKRCLQLGPKPRRINRDTMGKFAIATDERDEKKILELFRGICEQPCYGGIDFWQYVDDLCLGDVNA